MDLSPFPPLHLPPGSAPNTHTAAPERQVLGRDGLEPGGAHGAGAQHQLAGLGVEHAHEVAHVVPHLQHKHGR